MEQKAIKLTKQRICEMKPIARGFAGEVLLDCLRVKESMLCVVVFLYRVKSVTCPYVFRASSDNHGRLSFKMTDFDSKRLFELSDRPFLVAVYDENAEKVLFEETSEKLYDFIQVSVKRLRKKVTDFHMLEKK